MKVLSLLSVIEATLLFSAASAFAHGAGPGHIDEGQSPPTWITVIMVISWILIAIIAVLFVIRLIRKGNGRNSKSVT